MFRAVPPIIFAEIYFPDNNQLSNLFTVCIANLRLKATPIKYVNPTGHLNEKIMVERQTSNNYSQFVVDGVSLN